jgi:uncharacterized protein (TIGR02996 family)
LPPRASGRGYTTCCWPHTGAGHGRRSLSLISTKGDSSTPGQLVDARLAHRPEESSQPIFRGHTGPLTTVCFSPDGKRLASSASSQLVKAILDSPDDEALRLILANWHLDHEQEQEAAILKADGALVLRQGAYGDAYRWRERFAISRTSSCPKTTPGTPPPPAITERYTPPPTPSGLSGPAMAREECAWLRRGLTANTRSGVSEINEDAETRPHKTGKRILVIEDNRDSADSLQPRGGGEPVADAGRRGAGFHWGYAATPAA